MSPFEFRQEGYLWFWERKRFGEIRKLVELTAQKQLSRLMPKIGKILFSDFLGFLGFFGFSSFCLFAVFHA